LGKKGETTRVDINMLGGTPPSRPNGVSNQSPPTWPQKKRLRRRAERGEGKGADKKAAGSLKGRGTTGLTETAKGS